MAAAPKGIDTDVGFLSAQTELCEDSLAEYIKRAWPIIEPVTRYLHNWHIDAIAEHLEDVTYGKTRRLIINIPPRYSKSTAVAVMWPVWEWGPRNRPFTRWMFGSYSADLSRRHSNYRTTIIKSPWYQKRWGNRFKLTIDRVDEVVNSARGHMIATSVGGQATGTGGNRLVIDDLLKADQGFSKLEREKANRVFDTTFFNRLDDKKRDAIVIIMQRLHEEDLVGHVLERVRDEKWTTLVLPGEAEGRQIVVFPRSGTIVERREGQDTMILRRKPEPDLGPLEKLTSDLLGFELEPAQELIEDGGLLWPEREGPKEIAEQKLVLASYGWASQYQQRPAPLGGGLIKRSWFQFYKEVGCRKPGRNRR